MQDALGLRSYLLHNRFGSEFNSSTTSLMLLVMQSQGCVFLS